MSLSGTTLHVAGRDITLSGFESVNLTGGAGDNTFTFTSGFGSATVATGGGSDTLDLTGLTGVTHPTDTTFGDSAATRSRSVGAKPDHIDLTLASPATIVSKIDNIFDEIQSVVSAVDSGGNALSSALPLLDPNAGGTVDKILNLVSSFTAAKTKVDIACSARSPR